MKIKTDDATHELKLINLTGEEAASVDHVIDMLDDVYRDASPELAATLDDVYDKLTETFGRCWSRQEDNEEDFERLKEVG